MDKKLDDIVSLCKRRGFVFPGSDIYGGLANTWDYGPYGAQLKQNIKAFWWNTFVRERDDVIGLDSAILMNPKVWEASGHVTSFSDPLMDCKNCKERIRGDKLIEESLGIEAAAGKTLKQIGEIIKENKLKCPKCGKMDFTEPRSFNLMFRTHQGVVEETSTAIYLRPETAQGIFTNFKNVIQTCRAKVPFGIAQIGKSFRNEITPGNFTYRTREFEQMEIEYFVSPKEKAEIKKIFDEWKKSCWEWYLALGVNKENLRFREHEKDELSHYSSMTFDIEYKFPFGWGELMGLAYRGDYDLTQHSKFSGKDLSYLDPFTNEKYIPHVIEPSFGADRTLLITLIDAYDEDEVDGEKRTVMRFDPKIAPVKAAIFPLMKKDELTGIAKEIFDTLKKKFDIEYDDSGAIGKRYRRQDEIGTPFCVTVDYDTIADQTVTIRERDSMKQERVKIEDLEGIILNKIA
ncbi:glycine--tRNA ligase [Candidatus Peregrinibacteria bacterium CG_4_10_14_0_2_um_filter_38_24]|nr:MAG: glycine--tRNA ligase [Candidatus Peregrinibacteria bacterium CG_4_10_14_0_2_um_filter_38_24]PJC38634.1 MAG: glycine--tRNA ligase [Candidatus Peregrinibacteria bacterium CG_4_9_14_0_2_um_filter_38_9]